MSAATTTEMTSLERLLARVGPKRPEVKVELPTSVVTHDAIDDLMLGNCKEDSPKYRRAVDERAPKVEPNIEEPEPIDFTEASREEIKAYQEQARARRDALENAETYGGWESLADDLWRAHHTHHTPMTLDQVHPGSEIHKRIMEAVLSSEAFAEARHVTRDDPTLTSIAVMSAVDELVNLLEDKLRERVREREEREQAEKEAEERQDEIEDILPPDFPYPTPEGEQPGGEEGGTAGAPGTQPGGEGTPTPKPVKLSPKAQKQLQGALDAREAARKRAEELQSSGAPLAPDVLEAVEEAAQAGQEAAEAASHAPTFGSGLGKGEPVYESPEQAISVAERWSQGQLRQMAELAGRLKATSRSLRAKRIEGGNEEIVDVIQGNDLPRVLPSEFAMLGDEDLEDLVLMRFLSGQMLQFEKVGEEHAGRGPIGMVVDGSGSMKGERNIMARATALAWLHIARLEKRDFFMIEFSGGGQLAEWIFTARKPLDPEQVLDMASHFFNGGTTPITGITRAAEIMASVKEFKKADLVLVGDGDAGFGPEDEKLRDKLTGLGVRLFGIGIGELTGNRGTYLDKYCEHVVDVHDFELSDPSTATAELATHIT